MHRAQDPLPNASQARRLHLIKRVQEIMISDRLYTAQSTRSSAERVSGQTPAFDQESPGNYDFR